jgi:DNA polymerase III subunit alpha
MNSRQLEGLVAAGALDALEPNRAKLFANVDLLLAVSEAANRERESGQAALFGGEAQPDTALRLKDVEEWTRAERMARERDNFGFYFSAHPVEQFRAIASANGARSFASLMESGGPTGGRAPAVMAAMVEKVNKGRTRKGKDFVRADFSDSSGQFSAACFEEALVANFVKWADEGTCVLLNVELDSPSPDEPPRAARVTVRSARPLRDVKAAARMLLSVDVDQPEAIHSLKAELTPGPEGQGEVRVRLRTGSEGEPTVRLGRSFHLDGELAERLASIEGLANVQLTTQRGPNLRLVA